MTAMLKRLYQRLGQDGVSRAALLLVAGRTVGFVAAFAIPVVLARTFDQAAFGTYKQLFLIYATFYGLAQLGAAESLYYFVPRRPEEAGRRVGNALITLSLTGIACFTGLYLGRFAIAGSLSNAALASELPLLGLFLAFMLVGAAFEIVMVSRKEHTSGASVYAVSDVVRTALFLVPAFVVGSLHSVLAGAVVFAGLRLVAMLAYFWREFGRGFRIDTALWRSQLAYALPFALAVGIEVVQVNYHQWVVAARFDAATFAIYAVGCLQIPLIDLVYTSTCNVMMVRMAELVRDGDCAVLSLWHDTTARLASIIFPLAAVLMLTAHGLIVLLFTTTYLASVPVFLVWCLMILPSAFAVDGVLRVYAQTRFLLVMNIARLLIVAGLIGWFISTWGLIGAVLVTLAGTTIVKAAALVRIAKLMHVGFAEVLPWKRLAIQAAHATAAVVPAWILMRFVATFVSAPFLSVAIGGTTYAVTFALIWYVRVTRRSGGFADRSSFEASSLIVQRSNP
jgi:O-antigen/teichoic acid export membrane protein